MINDFATFNISLFWIAANRKIAQGDYSFYGKTANDFNQAAVDRLYKWFVRHYEAAKAIAGPEAEIGVELAAFLMEDEPNCLGELKMDFDETDNIFFNPQFHTEIIYGPAIWLD
jgi:hypothetical protein